MDGVYKGLKMGHWRLVGWLVGMVGRGLQRDYPKFYYLLFTLLLTLTLSNLGEQSFRLNCLFCTFLFIMNQQFNSGKELVAARRIH